MHFKVLVAVGDSPCRGQIACNVFGRFSEAMVFEAENLNELMDQIRRHRFDVVVLDDKLPGMDGISPANLMPRLPAATLILSSSDDAVDGRNGTALDDRGRHVSASDSVDDLLASIYRVLGGGGRTLGFTNNSWSMAGGIGHAAGAGPMGASSPRRLTPRQTEILSCLQEGQSNKEIARNLGIREGTVKVQLKTIYRQLGVGNRTQAAIMAVRVPPPADGFQAMPNPAYQPIVFHDLPESVRRS